MHDRNLTERLIAADPVPGERLSPQEQQEADELLARLLATPSGSYADRRSSRRPRVRLAAALGAACAAVAAVAAVTLLGPGAPGSRGIVAKAVAAVTREHTVYHVLERTRATGAGVSKQGQTVYSESWRTTDGRMHTKMFAANGSRRGPLLAEMAGRQRPGRRSGPALRYDPRANTVYPSGFGPAPNAGAVPEPDPFADAGASLRELERTGRLRLAGTTSFGGRRAYRLVADPTVRWRGFRYDRIEFLVDSETYLPLAQRVSVRFDGRTFRSFTRYLVYERLPLDARSRALLALDPHPRATCAPGAGDLRGDRGLGFPNPCPPSE